METIIQLLQSYFRFRSAVLRALNIDQLSKTEFSQLTGLDGETKYRRQKNPKLWKPIEIHRLGMELGICEGTTFKLTELAFLLDQLPEQIKKFIYKYSSLNEKKLAQRLHFPESWQPQELENILYILETRFTEGKNKKESNTFNS